MTFEEKIKKITLKEKELGLYEDEILNIPIWRIFRFRIRTQYFKRTTDFNNKSNAKSVKPLFLFKQYCSSFYKIAKLFILNKSYKNVVFAFPRLTKLDDLYLDKFTDPVIKHSNVKENVLIFQRNIAGNDYIPRAHQEQTIESDFIDLTAKIFSIIFFPLFVLLYGKKVKNIYNKAQSFFVLPKSFLISSIITVGEFYVSCYLNKIILKKINAKNVFIVSRGAFKSVILGGRKAKAKVFELQHGVTMADTLLYTGEYHTIADPDYFLTFGEKWIGPQFYIPLEKMVNIGWAYKQETLQGAKKFEVNHNDILVISSPSCTFKLFNLVHELSKQYPKRIFYLRLHPQEAYQKKQLAIIEQTLNLKIESRPIDSAIIVHLYAHIIGENSSVLFEALCAGKKVARLKMNGLEIKDQGGVPQKGFYYLQSIKDFDDYVNDESPRVNNNLGIYDAFKEKTVNQLIE